MREARASLKINRRGHMIYDQVYDTFVESMVGLKEAIPFLKEEFPIDSNEFTRWMDAGITGNINGQSFDISSDDIKRAENVVITHGAPAIEAPAFDKIKRVLTTLPKSPEDVQRVYNENFEGVIGTSLLSGMARENTLMGGYAFQRLAWTEGRNILYGVNSEGLPDLNPLLLNHINLKSIYFFFLDNDSMIHTYTNRLFAMRGSQTTTTGHTYKNAQSEIIDMIRSDVFRFLYSDMRPIFKWSPEGSAKGKSVLKTYLTRSVQYGIQDMHFKDLEQENEKYGRVTLWDRSIPITENEIQYLLTNDLSLIPSFTNAVTGGRATDEQCIELFEYLRNIGKNMRGKQRLGTREAIAEILGIKNSTFKYQLNILINNGFFNKWIKLNRTGKL